MSLKTSAVAHVIVLLVGTPVAFLLGTRVFRGRGLLIGLVELPVVLPPAVAGIALLAALGTAASSVARSKSSACRCRSRRRRWWWRSSSSRARSTSVRPPRRSPPSTDCCWTPPESLGRGPGRRPRVALPLAAGGLAAGSSLAFARGLGESEPTIIFAGSFAGVTRTAPLAIYAELDRDFDVAVALGVLLVVFSLRRHGHRRPPPRPTRSSSRSPFLFAPSISDSTSA